MCQGLQKKDTNSNITDSHFHIPSEAMGNPRSSCADDAICPEDEESEVGEGNGRLEQRCLQRSGGKRRVGEGSTRCQKPTPAFWSVDGCLYLGPRDSNQQLRVIKTKRHLRVSWGDIQKKMILSKCIFLPAMQIRIYKYIVKAGKGSTLLKVWMVKENKL